MREGGRECGREDGMERGREEQRNAGAKQTHLRAEEKRGEMRAGAPAREIRVEGREDGKRKKEEEKQGR